jgi:hypothetical protein
MAEHGAVPCVQNRSKPSPFAGDDAVADRVDPLADRVQPAGSESAVDCARTQPKAKQLRTRNHPMLASGKPRHLPIPTGPRLHSTSICDVECSLERLVPLHALDCCRC